MNYPGNSDYDRLLLYALFYLRAWLVTSGKASKMPFICSQASIDFFALTQTTQKNSTYGRGQPSTTYYVATTSYWYLH